MHNVYPLVSPAKFLKKYEKWMAKMQPRGHLQNIIPNLDFQLLFIYSIDQIAHLQQRRLVEHVYPLTNFWKKCNLGDPLR